jgi:hypothetical protein
LRKLAGETCFAMGYPQLLSLRVGEQRGPVEKMHQNWTIDGQYMPPPSSGRPLAEIDPALIVEPPEGLEVGYVPIVTRQEA